MFNIVVIVAGILMLCLVLMGPSLSQAIPTPIGWEHQKEDAHEGGCMHKVRTT
jgi:hypothetical protein